MSASPSPRRGRITLAHSPVGCVAPQPSCVRSAIEVAFKKEGKALTRIVHITASAPENAGAQPSAPSAQPASGANVTNVIDFAANRTADGCGQRER